MQSLKRIIVLTVIASTVAISFSACHRPGASSDDETPDTSTYRPLPTPFGISIARPELMALANLLEHPEIRPELMSGPIQLLGTNLCTPAVVAILGSGCSFASNLLTNPTGRLAFAQSVLTTGQGDTDHFHDECGVFGIYGHPDAAALTALGLHAVPP